MAVIWPEDLDPEFKALIEVTGALTTAAIEVGSKLLLARERLPHLEILNPAVFTVVAAMESVRSELLDEAELMDQERTQAEGQLCADCGAVVRLPAVVWRCHAGFLYFCPDCAGHLANGLWRDVEAIRAKAGAGVEWRRYVPAGKEEA